MKREIIGLCHGCWQPIYDDEEYLESSDNEILHPEKCCMVDYVENCFYHCDPVKDTDFYRQTDINVDYQREMERGLL